MDELSNVQVFRKMSDEEKKALQTFVIDGMPRQVDEIKSRRKKKGDFQYEVSWRNLPSIKYNKWFGREVRRAPPRPLACQNHVKISTHLRQTPW